MALSNLKEPLDTQESQAIRLEKAPKDGTRQFTPNYEGGSSISSDVWAEFIPVAQYLCHVFDDPDIYDLFMWIREELNGCQPLSDSLIDKVDKEIERELGPWI